MGIGDFDNDGRQDVFFTGNQVSSRLYLNRFTPGRDRLRFEDVTEAAGVTTNAWCTGVTVVDINQDGWADIYLSVAGPDSSRRANLLFVNQGKHTPTGGVRFREQAREYGLADTGYSTQTAFLDYDHDGDLDAYVLTNAEGKVRIAPTQPTNAQGCWNTLIAHDFDRDGDMDVMAGNLGLNTRHKASPDQPIELYAADFDQNGSLDPVLTHYNDGQKCLTPTRDVLTAQVPAMKQRFPDFISYAKSTFADAFRAEELESAYHVQATEFRSMYFENRGGGIFVPHPLPLEAQVSPVYGILVDDFNHDGLDDALLVGNSYASETIGGWYDASKGALLLGNGRGDFKPADHCGINAAQDAKAVVALRRKGGATWILVANNAGPLQGFQCRPPERSPPP
ncbi:MAG: VCBS repeat-containing protein [Cytophagaceae bacterium]|nr:VCBS repeat-containing protein [Cytophagaceae bacterium]